MELLLVRHGYSCANAWKKKLMGIHLMYADPELTEEGKRLCEERKTALQDAIRQYFQELPYMIATSSLVRTQQTAYHMLLKGTHDSYTIVPHVAEEGFTPDNIPLSAQKQQPILGPSVLNHLKEDLRGSTSLKNKSNWPKFVAWAKAHGLDRAVIFTHGKFMRTAMNISDKPRNNDIFYVKYDTETGQFLEKKRLTLFPEPPVSVEGCRIHKKLHYITKTRKNRSHYRRRTYRRR
jgi:broad specificity phosphatase PhoE